MVKILFSELCPDIEKVFDNGSSVFMSTSNRYDLTPQDSKVWIRVSKRSDRFEENDGGLYRSYRTIVSNAIRENIADSSALSTGSAKIVKQFFESVIRTKFAGKRLVDNTEDRYARVCTLLRTAIRKLEIAERMFPVRNTCIISGIVFPYVKDKKNCEDRRANFKFRLKSSLDAVTFYHEKLSTQYAARASMRRFSTELASSEALIDELNKEPFTSPDWRKYVYKCVAFNENVDYSQRFKSYEEEIGGRGTGPSEIFGDNVLNGYSLRYQVNLFSTNLLPILACNHVDYRTGSMADDTRVAEIARVCALVDVAQRRAMIDFKANFADSSVNELSLHELTNYIKQYLEEQGLVLEMSV